jgi:16S rRNA (guanine527-N7)-methyltransferase
MPEQDITSKELLETLRQSQRLGMLGGGSLERAIEHAGRFADALPDDAAELVDLGSGGGLPGLVVAWRRPAARITLIDRRAARTDVLRRAVTRLGWQDRLEVVTGDVVQFARGPWRGRFDAATARGFGPPAWTLACGAAIVRPRGRVVISEPPAEHGDRWDDDELASLGVRRVADSPAGLAVFQVERPLPAHLPGRRTG